MAHGKKTGGRKAGTANRATADLRKAISNLLDINWDTLQADIESLEPKDRLAFIEKLIAYTLPKPQAVNLQANATDRLNELSNDELNSLIDLILEAKHSKNP